MNLDKRKYATSKIHSDAWNGQVCDAICMTMVDGDVRNNSVEYYCPINPSKNICTEAIVNRPITNGAIPTSKESQNKIMVIYTLIHSEDLGAICLI